MPPKSIEELDETRRRCKAMLKRRAAISGGASLIPVPGLDFAADVGMLLELIPAINRKFGLSPEQIEDLDAKHKTLVYAMIKKVGTMITRPLVLAALKKVSARMAAKQVLKYIPFAGQAAAAALSIAAMMYVGNSHIDECYEVARRTLDD